MADPDPFLPAWAAVGRELAWSREPDAVFAERPRRGSWFPGGRLNVAVNCIDRHLPERRDAVAFYWEGEPGDRRTITYGQLDAEVRRFAAVLRALEIGPGDRVALHMGLLPETVVAMLACARVGAVHAVLPAVLPADAVEQRIANIEARMVITQDGAWRHGAMLPLKARVDEAVAAVPSVHHTIVVRRTGVDVAWYEGDRWLHDLVAAVPPAPDEPEGFPSEHPLCIAHVAGRRQRPIGVVHGSANFLAYLLAVHRGLLGGGDDVFWFPSELGWLAGQSHGIYGPLVCGGTSVLYEGMLDTPSPARTWEIAERYRVGVLVSTPSVLRNLRIWSADDTGERDLGALHRVVSAGEPVEADLVAWARSRLPDRVELVDAWGQTELGGIIASNAQGAAARDIDPGFDVVDEEGRSLPAGAGGELVLRRPWPGTFVGIEGDATAPLRCFDRYPGAYATGDRAHRNPDGTLTFLGRIDPVISVSGQLVSLTEVEETLLEHPHVVSAIVAHRPDPHTSQAVVALVEPENGADRDRLALELGEHVHETLGGLSRPRTIVFVDGLPGSVPQGALRGALRALCVVRATTATFDTTPTELAALVDAHG